MNEIVAPFRTKSIWVKILVGLWILITVTIIFLMNVGKTNTGEPVSLGLFVWVFLGFLAAFFVPASNLARWHNNFRGRKIKSQPRVPFKKTFWTTLLFGGLGVHRFINGKVITGLLYLFTLGGFFIGWILDFLMVTMEVFIDGEGQLVTRNASEPVEQRPSSLQDQPQKGKATLPVFNDENMILSDVKLVRLERSRAQREAKENNR